MRLMFCLLTGSKFASLIIGHDEVHFLAETRDGLLDPMPRTPCVLKVQHKPDGVSGPPVGLPDPETKISGQTPRPSSKRMKYRIFRARGRRRNLVWQPHSITYPKGPRREYRVSLGPICFRICHPATFKAGICGLLVRAGAPHVDLFTEFAVS